MKKEINYVIGGRTGDLIHNLLVIKSNYEKYGRKGNLYLSDKHGGDSFAFPLEHVHKDLSSVILFQEYINDFKIYNGEPIEVNLNSWRGSPLLFKNCWTDILSHTYNITPSSEPWLKYEASHSPNYTVIHRSLNRNTATFPWDELLSIPNEQYLFVTSSAREAIAFEKRLKQYKIDIVISPSFGKIVDYINSAKRFIGNMSAPLAIAHALGKPRLAELFHTDEIHYIGDVKYLPNFWYIKDGQKEIPSMI